MKKLVATWVMVLLLLPMNALAEEIVLTVLKDFSPFQWQEENGQVVGTDADIIREVCKRLKIGLKYQVMPWKRCLHAVKGGDVTGIITALYKKERDEFLYYTKETIHIQKNVVMTWKGSGMRITGLDDLKGKLIAVVRGFSYGPEFDSYEGLKKEVCGDQKDLVRILAKGRVDVAMGSLMPLMYNAKQLGLQGKLEVAYVMTEYPTYTVFSKTLGEKGKSLAERFDGVLKQMKQEGVEQRIIDSYVK